MKSFSFIHTADLHLDSPFTGLRQVDGAVASLIKDTTFRAFDNVVDLALAKKVDFFLVAGDVYDAAFDGIIVQAVMATVATFLGMLVLYATGIIKASPRFRKVVIGATFGIVIFYATLVILLNLVVDVLYAFIDPRVRQR